MNQTKLGSFIETCVNTAIGYVIAVSSQIVIFPMFDIHVPLSDNFKIGLWFTVISIARGYVLRRWFNARLHRAAQKLVGAGDES
jgi:hypothetical protein